MSKYLIEKIFLLCLLQEPFDYFWPFIFHIHFGIRVSSSSKKKYSVILIKLVVSQLNVWRKDIVIILSIGNHGNCLYFQLGI